MDRNEQRIDNLKKVRIALEAGTGPDVMDLTSEPYPLEFIFGLGVEGLTPLEFRLVDKSEGDKLVVKLRPEEMNGLHQNLVFPAFTLHDHMDSFFLRIEILRVVPADQREVIKALAELSGCGSHCCDH